MSGLEPDPPVADHFREFYTQILHFLRTLLRDNTSEQQVQAILKAQASREDRLR